MSTSPGSYGAKNALESGSKLLVKLGGELIENYSLPKFKDNFQNGKIINEEFDAELFTKINEFRKKI